MSGTIVDAADAMVKRYHEAEEALLNALDPYCDPDQTGDEFEARIDAISAVDAELGYRIQRYAVTLSMLRSFTARVQKMEAEAGGG